MIRVYQLKVGTRFRCLKKWYELLKIGSGSAYVRSVGGERHVRIEGVDGSEPVEFDAPGRGIHIGLTTEVDEVAS
jgi:hypothetical protein